jgi:hypothetical protein
MARQFPDVNCTYGAPMGRREYGHAEDSEPRSVRLFRVVLVQGYDDGGAYWGCGVPLWCATDGGDYRRFMRAWSRRAAAQALGLESGQLRVRLRGTDTVPADPAQLDGRR